MSRQECTLRPRLGKRITRQAAIAGLISPPSNTPDPAQAAFRAGFSLPCSLFFSVSVRQYALLFRGDQAHYAVNGVGRAILPGVVMAHLQLTQQAESQQLNSSH